MNRPTTWLLRLLIAALVVWPAYLLSRDPVAAATSLDESRARDAVAATATRPRATTRLVWLKDTDLYQGGPSPDGRHFAFTDWESCDLAIRNLASGAVRRLGLSSDDSCDEWGEFAVYSPDGKQMAFMWHVGSNDEGGDELRVVDVDSPRPRVLVPPSDEQRIYPQDWTPDGSSVAFVMAREGEPPQLALAATSGSTPRILKTFATWHAPSSIRMRVSPDARFIAYSFPSAADDGRLDVHLLAMSEGRDIPIFQHIAADYIVGWADATHLVFASDRGGSPGLWSLNVANGRPAGGPSLIRGDLWQMYALRLTASGEVFYIVRSGDSDIHTASIDLTTGSLGPLSSGITGRPGLPHGYAAWSPDGRYLAFATHVNPLGGAGSQVVTIRALERGETREYRPKSPYIHALTWIPNTQALVARVSDPLRGGDELVRLDLQTGDVTPLLRPFRGLPLFSPDGRSMYYMAADSDRRLLEKSDGSRLIARELSTGAERVLYTPPEGYVLCCSFATAPLGVVTPDGRSVLLSIVDGERPTHMRLISVSVDGGPPRELPFAASEESLPFFRILGLSSDGGSVIVIRGAQPRGLPAWSLWRAPLNGTPAELIAPPRPDFAPMVLSPDGRHIALPRATTGAVELWVLEDESLRGGASAPGR